MGGSSFAVRTENLWFAYPRTGPVLKGITLAIPAGSIWTVFGPSGAGKTTLVKILAGLLRAEKGTVELLGQPLVNGMPPDLRRQVGYIPQQLGLVRGLTALENVLLGSLGRQEGVRPLLGLFPSEDVECAREYLALLGVEQKAGEKVMRLSGGERQRVAIARTLLQGPRVIFADEFVSDLDLPRATRTLALMAELGRRQGLTFLINLHEVEMLQEFADYALILKDGAIVHQGPAATLTREVLRAALE